MQETQGYRPRLAVAVHTTREQWLLAATDELRPLFEEHGAQVPAVYVSVGWPRGSRGKHKVIGQCFPSEMVQDGTAAVFISPVLENPVRVLDVLAHELVHATVGTQCGHRGPFRKLAKSLGLEGPMPATHAGEALTSTLKAIVEKLGPYPHSQVSDVGVNKQSTRMLKLECGAWDDADGTGQAGCGMIIRTTRKWVEEIGMPSCACGGRFTLA